MRMVFEWRKRFQKVEVISKIIFTELAITNSFGRLHQSYKRQDAETSSAMTW